MSKYPVATLAVREFSCLGAECPDTCCRGWDMPSDAGQRARMAERAPELLATVDAEKSIMKRDAATQECEQLCAGMCRIHGEFGAEFLSDSCYFYPRITHHIGRDTMLAGAASCPEMLRLMLHVPHAFVWRETEQSRMPAAAKPLDIGEFSPPEALALMQTSVNYALDESLSPEAILQQLLTLAGVPQTEPMLKSGDAHAVYYALALTEAFAAPGISQRLPGIMQRMEQALDCRFDRAERTIVFGPNATHAARMLQARWRVDAAHVLAPALRHWIAAQLQFSAFPFGGFRGLTMAERGAILAQRFATVRLALMCHVAENGVAPDEATLIHVMQGIARFMDHLADAKLTLMIHRDSGWNEAARLRGLVA